jgi:hypothetical protein
LGLRPSPSAPELIEMMASKDESLRVSAMTYFIANHHTNRYFAFDVSSCRKAIMPLQGSSQLVVPSACFTNERASILGFQILRKDLHDHANVSFIAPFYLRRVLINHCLEIRSSYRPSHGRVCESTSCQPSPVSSGGDPSLWVLCVSNPRARREQQGEAPKCSYRTSPSNFLTQGGQ